MDKTPWESLSPLNFTFRAYGVEEKRDLFLNAVEGALGQFKFCDAIQIEITAPPKESVNMTSSDENRNNSHSAGTIVKGFAG